MKIDSRVYIQIENRYTYHKSQPEDLFSYQELRSKAKELAYLIEKLCPDNREKSIAHTKLQEFIMFANCSIALSRAEIT